MKYQYRRSRMLYKLGAHRHLYLYNPETLINARGNAAKCHRVRNENALKHRTSKSARRGEKYHIIWLVYNAGIICGLSKWHQWQPRCPRK